MSFRSRAAVIGVLAAVPLLALTSPAFAHAGLVSTSPVADSVVTTSPDQVVLTFDEAVLDQGAGILVTDQAGTHYEIANTLHFGGAKISIKLQPLGDAGVYTVAWRVVADDGDPQSQTYTFTYQPAGNSTGATSTPSATASVTPSASAPPGNNASDSSGSSSAALWWVLLAAVVVIVIMGVIVLMRRGRGGSDPSN
jgi:YD repeat-containing protein